MFLKFFHSLPLIILNSIMNVFITSTVSGFIMVQMASNGYGYYSLLSACIAAIITYTWIVFNYKIRNSIKELDKIE